MADPSSPKSPRGSAPILAVALFSGAAALVYEIVFFRSLGLLFGAAIHAVAAVVTSFLGGLGLGAWLGGRLLHRGNPLRIYAALELLTAAFGIASPWVFAAARAFAAPPPGDSACPAGTLALSFLLLLWPTLMMGATFPVLGRAVAAGLGPEGIARRVGLLYGWNTAGAFLGTLLAAYVLLPAAGLQSAAHAAAAANLALAGAALWLSSRRAGLAPGAAAQAAAGGAQPLPRQRNPLILCVLLTGCASIALQVLGTRLLITLLGASVFAFASVLAVFLLGIALGGAAGGGRLARGGRPLFSLAACCVALAGAVGLGFLLLRLRLGAEDPLLGGRNLGHPDEACGLLGFLATSGAMAALAFLPATLLSGAILPAAARACGSAPGSLSRGLGALYAANTAGSVLGSLGAAFLLLPRLGLRMSLLVVACVALAAALPALFAARQAREHVSAPLLAVIFLAAAALVGAGLRPGAAPGRADGLTGIFYAESPASSVKVFQLREASEPEPVRCLFVNGKPVATSLFMDRRLQLLLGFIPTLAHPEPRRILSIGLGTGMSSGALAMSGAESVEIVELSRAVLDACPIFDQWTGRVLERQNVRAYVDDGRAFLQRSSGRYDLISADPIHPWVAGSAYLFTVEYYTLAREHLAHGGLMSQWIPLYELTTADIAGILATFCSVFPEVSAWVTGYDMVLLGGAEPLAIDADRVQLALSREPTRACLADVGVFRPHDLLACFFAGTDTLRALARRAPALITDDYPWIEFTSPLSAFQSGYATEVFRILAAATDEAPLAAATSEALRERTHAANQRLRQAALDFAAAIDARAAFGAARAAYSDVLRTGHRG
ncbi:MAG: fused MFS/spermidine synthase [Planctomycetes bacterium]|nr:fused MFS/spermidine synthase [Planctomycetota bacterium]